MVTRYLSTRSFRNRLAEGAIEAIRMQDDPSYTRPLMEKLTGDEHGFTSPVFGQALDTLAYIARNEENRSEIGRAHV
jgi:hypothetical protein